MILFHIQETHLWDGPYFFADMQSTYSTDPTDGAGWSQEERINVRSRLFDIEWDG